MSGIKTNLKDLGKCANKFFRAMQAEDARKREFINEHKHSFMKAGYQPWMATMKAQEKYHLIHKNDPK